MFFFLVAPSKPTTECCLPDDPWVEAGGEGYELICVVDESKPPANIYWEVAGNKENTEVTVSPVGTDGIKKVTGTRTHIFSKTPASQKVTYVVERSESDSTEVHRKDYKTVEVYCE